jgi:hypothetical protein
MLVPGVAMLEDTDGHEERVLGSCLVLPHLTLLPHEEHDVTQHVTQCRTRPW